MAVILGFLLGIPAGIGLLLMATRLWGMCQNRRWRRSGEVITLKWEAEEYQIQSSMTWIRATVVLRGSRKRSDDSGIQ
jgi:hypothetical protein